MKEVNSSNISHVGYDEATKTLKVKFKANGAEYHYQDVPKDVHTAMLEAKSVGAFHNKEVKNKYKFTKVN